jgi:hypothetical protein
MAQYRIGTVSLTHNSNVVTSAGTTAFTTNVTAGDLFTLQQPGITNPTYQVAGVTDDTHLTLTVPYAGSTIADQFYAIVRDFTTNLDLPLMPKGSVETGAIFSAAMQKLDASIILNTVITSPTVGQVLTYEGGQWVNKTDDSDAYYVYLDDYVTSVGYPCGYGAVVTSGAPDVNLAGGQGALQFNAGMVGQTVQCSGFSGPVTVATYVSPTHITLSANATSTTSFGRIMIYQTGSDDTSAIAAACAAVTSMKAILKAGSRGYVVSSTVTLSNIQAFEGQSDGTTFFVSKGLFGFGSGSAPKGNMFFYPNAPASFIARDFTLVGPGNRTPAYLSQMVVSGGVLTATVSNSTTMDAGATIMLLGSRGSAKFLRWTNFKLRSGGGQSPTSTSFIGDAVTWDSRPGYSAISNVAIAAGVITLTTAATNSFESAEQAYIQSLATATFLNGVRATIVTTVQGTTSVQLTMPSWGITSVSLSGTTATYTGSFPSGSFAGTTVTFSGFTNVGNNGAFTVTSSSSTQIIVTNASGVNETAAASVQLTTYASAADTGNLSYIQDGTYVDTASAVHNYNGFELWSHPAQPNTITNRASIERVNALNFQGAGILWHQPNYAYVDRVECIGSNGGMLLASAYPTTGRFTDPSAFEVRGGNQLYGACYGFAAKAAAGLTIGMIGSNASGIAILLDGCSGVGISGLDLESERPLSGQTDLWPGTHIELWGGTGIKIAGVFNYEGEQSGSTTPNSASQVMFSALNGATAFEYSDSFHCAGAGYLQQTNEIVVDNSCSNYYIGRIATIGTSANVTIGGSNYETDLFGTNTKVSSVSGGTILQTSIVANSFGNHSSPPISLGTLYLHGGVSTVGGFTIKATPGAGTDPVETLDIEHNYGTPSSGGSKLSYQGGAFTVSGGGNITSTNLNSAAGGTNQPFPTQLFHGSYQSASGVSSQDEWGIGGTLAAGINGASTLTIFHNGTSGGGNIALFASSLYNFSGASATFGMTTASTSTTTGSLILAGGMGVAGAGYFGSLFDSGNRVLTNLTAGTAISISGSGPTGVTVTNTGVTALAGTTNQVAVSASTGSVTLSLPQNINSGAAPVFAGTNFTGIPNGALTNSAITVTGGTGLGVSGSPVALGGTVTLSNTGVTSNVAGTGVSVSGTTGAVTISIGQSVATSASPTFNALTLTTLNGTALSGTFTGNPAFTGTPTFSNALALGSSTATAQSAYDYSTKIATTSYVDAAVVRTGWLQPVRVSPTSGSNVNISSPGATIDGVTLSNGDRILLRGQTTSSQNGVWVFNGSSSALTRPADYNSAISSMNWAGTQVYITEGTTFSDRIYAVTTNNPITIDTTNTVWVQSGGGSLTLPGTGLSASGAFTLQISASYVGQTSLTTLGTITTGTWNGTKIAEIYGGTNQSTYTTGDILYASASNTLSKLGIGSTNQVLQVISGVPSWQTISGVTYANPTGTIGLTAVNGSTTTNMRSDAAPALSQAIVPSWTGAHTFNAGATITTASGAALTITGVARTTYAPSVLITAPNTTDQSNGLQIKAGTSTNDAAFVLTTAGTSTYNYFQVIGDSSFAFARDATHQTLLGNSAGNITINSPSSGTALTVNAATSADGIGVIGPSGWPAYIECAGNAGTIGTTGFLFGQDGSQNAVLYNHANTPIQISTNATQRMVIGAAGNITINAPSSGAALTVNSLSTAGGVSIVSGTGTANTLSSGAVLSAGNGTTSGSVFQSAGNQTEIWQYNGAWNQVLYCDSSKSWHMPAALIANNAILGAGNVGLSSGDLSIARAGGTSAAIYFNGAGTQYLYYDGTNMVVPLGTFLAPAFEATSDRKLKTNIINIDSALNKVDQLNGVTFDWIKSGQASAGLIAQDVQEVLPEAVHTSGSGANDEIESHLVLNYNAVIGLLVEAVKELRAEVNSLKAAR